MKPRTATAGLVAQGMVIQKANPSLTSPVSEWLTAKAACAHAKCSRQTLWRWKKDGLASGRGGRIRRHDLDAWLADMPEDQANPSPTTEQLKVKQAAARAGVTRQTIWRWSDAGLKVQRRGRVVRIRADVLDGYIAHLPRLKCLGRLSAL